MAKFKDRHRKARLVSAIGETRRAHMPPGSQLGGKLSQIIIILSSTRFTPGAAQAARSAMRRS